MIDRLIGRKLSHYRVVRRIGTGGMGVVYQARDPRLERDVALKVLTAGMLHGRESRERFRQEALALSRLNHPNIATIYDFDTAQEVDFLVMELISGTTLGDRLKRGPIPGVQALAVGMQMAEALEFSHGQGVIHRDLKPGNVMLTVNGLVKVLDFGLARAPAEATAAIPAAGKRTAQPRRARATGLSQAMGTPGYMSPEQIQGQRQDGRADVFAFACVLFECMAGERAFGGETAEEVIAAVLTQPPNWTALPAGTPPKVRDLLGRCLEKDQLDRVAHIREVRQELEKILGARGRVHRPLRGQRTPAPHSLRGPGTSFVGRDAEIAECRRLLSRSRLLTLTGSAGCGKTRLALRVAEDAMADYPDGVWLADLAPLRDGARVPQAVASAIGAREVPDVAVLETLERFLSGKAVLLVLDNCEHHLNPCAELAQALLGSCPRVTILATSREGLRIPGEQSLVVPPLGVPPEEDRPTVESMALFESVRLFSERAARVKPEFKLSRANVKAVAEICRRLDGIPLAIELASSRVMALSPEEIRSKLDRRFRLLTSEILGAPARHQTLRAAIQWSHEQLTGDEQELFSALSVFSGGWTFESAASVCSAGQDEFAVLDLFTRLLDKSLIVAETSPDGALRYRYLETIREYALEALEGSGEGEAIRERHLDHFLSLAEEAAPKLTGPEQASWLARLDTEHENFLTALRWCEGSPGMAEKALRLTAALWRFWVARGHFGAGRRALDAALNAEGAGGRSVARAETLNGGGALAFHVNDWALGRSYCEESLEIFSDVGNSAGMADALVSLGNLALGQADYSAARGFYDQALARYRETGQRRGTGIALSNAGRAAELQGDLAAAASLYEEGLAVLREVGDLSSAALRLSSLGRLSLSLGDHVAARHRLMECLVLVQELKERRAGPYALERSAALLEAMGEPSEAAILCGASESLRERVGSPLTPRERIERDALIDLVRDELGAGPFTAAWADGLSLKFEPAVERALSSLDRMEPDAKGGDRSVDLESTAVLLEEVRGGDPAATARLVKRYLPILRRWAHGRLPQKARDMADTDDLVQVALIRGLGRVPDFEQRRTGAFLAYMRQILRNQIRDEIRRLANKARPVELPEDLPDGGASPLEEAIARESMERYEAALDTLPQKQRDGVVMRLEMGFSYLEIAEALGSPSEEAARISVRRALERLRRQMPGSDPAQG